MPSWLRKAQEDVDAAVAKAYGWTDYMTAMDVRELFKRWFALSRDRVAAVTDGGRAPQRSPLGSSGQTRRRKRALRRAKV